MVCMSSSYRIRLHLEWKPSNSSAHLSPSCPPFSMVWWNVLPAAAKHAWDTYWRSPPLALVAWCHTVAAVGILGFLWDFPFIDASVLCNAACELGLPKTAPIRVSVCTWYMLLKSRSEASQAVNAHDCLFTILPCCCLFAVLPCCCLFTVLPCLCLFTVLPCRCSHNAAACEHTYCNQCGWLWEGSNFRSLGLCLLQCAVCTYVCS